MMPIFINLSKNEIKGILLCKKDLINFYAKLGYMLNFEIKKDVFLMSLNFKNSDFTYRGDFF